MQNRPEITAWLPTTVKEAKKRGWDELDVVIITGDAYVDHPSFGHAVIGRIIESHGLKVAIVAQPNWQDDLRDFKKFGAPKLFFAVTSGSMDSMVNHYTANKRLRSTDAYTPGGSAGHRPDRATTVYTNILKKLYPSTPVIIGGIEASLRRFTHYDYWSDQLRPSILVDSHADLLVYGMGEKPLDEILNLLKKGIPFSSLTTVPQTAILQNASQAIPKNKNWEDIELSSHQECLDDKKKFATNFTHIERESNKIISKRIIQEVNDSRLIVNPPYTTMSQTEIDRSFDLPYTRLPHPKYKKRGDIPAFEMIKFSVNIHRGCFGGCSFCTISAHQGKHIVSRSKESIIKEIEQICQMDDFKGYLSDLGGPSANMYKMTGINQEQCQRCQVPSCIFPKICKNLNTDHQQLLDLYNAVMAIPAIKKAFVSSGIRYDLFDQKNITNQKYLTQLIENHVSGRLKVAPEHTSSAVLKTMRKPDYELFRRFKQKFDEITISKNLNYQIIPYFISAHPNCRFEDMLELVHITSEMGLVKLEQVQDFTPTPMTLSTVMFYTGLDPYTLQPIYVAKSKSDKLKQRNCF